MWKSVHMVAPVLGGWPHNWDVAASAATSVGADHRP